MAGLTRPIVVKPDLELGQTYKIQVIKKQERNGRRAKRQPSVKQGRLVYLTDRLAVFDNGYYRDCQMVKNYKYDWEVKRA